MSTPSTNLTKEILKTIIRFSLFNFPLTAWEIWQYLSLPATYEEVLEAIKQTGLINKQGFYFLPGNGEQIIIRQNRYRQAEQKIRLAQTRLKLISWLPTIKFIALANIIGPNNLKPEADLDLFIITKANRLWLTKFLATIILKLTNLRPTDKNSQNKLCLSFLIDETNFDLAACRLNNNDWYFTYWLAGLVPLIGNLETYENFLLANVWFKQALPNWQLTPYEPTKNFRAKKSDQKIKPINFLEKLSRQLHKLLMAKDLKNLQNQNTAVIITDHILKLHSLDRRPDFFTREEQIISNYE